MRAYSHDELETMSPEDILKAFKKNLTSKLDSLLVIAGNSDDDSIIVQTLDKIIVAATKFGKSFFEKIPMDMKVYVDCITLRKVEKPIGNHKCFVRLYKEGYRKKKLSAKTYKGTSLESTRRVASQIGHSLTSVFVKLMISLCVENRLWRIKRFDNLESLILLLKMMFKWKGKTNDFGVVFNRIIECIKIARHEFLGVPKLTQKRRGTIEVRRQTIDIIGCYSLNNFLQALVAELVGVPKLTQKRRGTIELGRKTIDIDDYYSLNNFLQELVTELVCFSTRFELLLSLPLLPSFENFLEAEIGSLDWLEEMSEHLDQNIDSKAEALLGKYTEESSAVYKFSLKMDRVTYSIWDDLRYLL